jgi:hypothetical protein
MAKTQIYGDTRGKSVCKSCGAPIEWAEMVASGRKMPFDGEIVAVRTEHEPGSHRLIEIVDLAVSISHFATCPNASNFRKAIR